MQVLVDPSGVKDIYMDDIIALSVNLPNLENVEYMAATVLLSINVVACPPLVNKLLPYDS